MLARSAVSLLAALVSAGCLTLLAPNLEPAVVGHGSAQVSNAPEACLECHPSSLQPVPSPSVGGSAPWVADWMLIEDRGQCLGCHGVADE